MASVAEYIVQLMNNAVLARRGGELLRDGRHRGLVAVTNLQVNRLDASRFESVKQVFPGLFVFAIPHAKSQHVSLPSFGNADHGQNGHFAGLAIIDHREAN